MCGEYWILVFVAVLAMVILLVTIIAGINNGD